MYMAKTLKPIDTRVKFGDILGNLKNITFNAIGIERDFDTLLADNDVSRAIMLMDDNSDKVDEIRMQLDTEMHYDVLMRTDRSRKGLDPYTAEKLPRALQNYINYVEYFFLLNYPVEFRNDTETNSEIEFTANTEAYNELMQVLKDIRFDALLEEAKLIAGGETEAAIAFDVEKDSENGQPYITANVISMGKGYKLRPLFDRKGRMKAFAYGWTERNDKFREVECWRIETAQSIYECKKNGKAGLRGWDVITMPNLSGKINVVYVQQDEAWKGSQRRIERREMLDSKAADTGNYVYSPLLVGKSDAIISLPDVNQAGVNAVQLKGDGADLRYLQSPNAHEQYKSELAELDRSIFIDTLTFNLDPQILSGFGDISGIAIKRIALISYIKRARNIRIYEPFIERVLSVLKANIGNITAIRYKEQLDKMDISFTFSDPFPTQEEDYQRQIADLYEKGVISLETAIDKLSMYDNYDLEIERIKKERGLYTNNVDIPLA